MDVKQSALEKLATIKLKKYLKPESKFSPTAIQYAYEILVARGVEFTKEEKTNIELLIKEKTANAERIEQVNKTSHLSIFIFSAIYCIITLLFIFDAIAHQSESLKYIVFFPAFWIIAAIVLFILVRLKVIIIQSTLDYVALLFATPIPVYTSLFILQFV